VIITDKLRSYAAAKRMVMPDIVHRQHRYLNNEEHIMNFAQGQVSAGSRADVHRQ
jgi:transposase-like protein